MPKLFLCSSRISLLLTCLPAMTVASAQVQPDQPAHPPLIASATLPDAPGSSFEIISAPKAVLTGFDPTAAQSVINAGGRYSKTVLPGQTAARLSVHDKVVLGIKENLSLQSAAGWAISAGYEQATNGSPNYGQTGKGFAQRLGAAAARGSSENIFGDSVLSSVLHEDPRYYVMGPGHNFFKRVIYAGTRPIIGKTDGGRTTINFSDLGGDLAGSALTQVYYPPLNRGTTEVLKTFGGSVGGDALGFLASEFLPGIFNALHLTHSNR